MQNEVDLQCPFCGEPIQIFVDPSVETQSYIEDCSVCCRPIQFEVRLNEEGEVLSVSSNRGS